MAELLLNDAFEHKGTQRKYARYKAKKKIIVTLHVTERVK